MLYDQSTRQFLGRRDLLSQDNSKSSQEPLAHFGLGTSPVSRMGVRVVLAGGHAEWFANIGPDQMVELRLRPFQPH